MEREPEELMLAKALLRAKSPSGSESEATNELKRAFERLGFDEAYLDAAGNAIGVIRRGEGPTVMFNGHLDTVPEGNPALWQHPPYEGVVAGGRLWGRGSCDMKSAVACMAVAARDAAEAGFAGTLLVTGVVQEEVGGLGARHLMQKLAADVIVLGEPSDLELKLGHRGRVEAVVRLPGRIAHAAKASLGENALGRAAHYLCRLERCDLPQGGALGASTATPTRLVTFPDGTNVVPGSAEITVDYRNIVKDTPEAIIERLAGLDPEAEVVIGEELAVSESGEVKERFPLINPAYLAPESAPEVSVARRSISESLADRGVVFREGVWWFATDAPYLAARGAPVIGFGPGDPELAHTTSESVPVEQLAIAREVYTRLALAYLGGA